MGNTLEIGQQTPADLRYTSLIGQLVPDVRPQEDLAREWPECVPDGDGQQVQICRIVETKNGQSATAEGLFYQLIVRLHRFSLGRSDYKQSVHWQRGLVLDDDYNGRALLEHVSNDVHITVRAPYPENFLAVLNREVKWPMAALPSTVCVDFRNPPEDRGPSAKVPLRSTPRNPLRHPFHGTFVPHRVPTDLASEVRALIARRQSA